MSTYPYTDSPVTLAELVAQIPAARQFISDEFKRQSAGIPQAGPSPVAQRILHNNHAAIDWEKLVTECLSTLQGGLPGGEEIRDQNSRLYYALSEVPRQDPVQCRKACEDFLAQVARQQERSGRDAFRFGCFYGLYSCSRQLKIL
jgi:hypothetical protein